MRLKRFNESTSEQERVFIVVIGNPDSYFGSDNFYKCFTTFMLGADYVIKYINKKYSQNFEPYLDSDGNRFFLSVEENEDFERCLSYCDGENIKIDIEDTVLHSTIIKE